jgi:hypothetical protein
VQLFGQLASRFLTAKDQVQSQDSPYGIYAGQSVTGADLFSEHVDFPVPVVISPVLHIHPSSGSWYIEASVPHPVVAVGGPNLCHIKVLHLSPGSPLHDEPAVAASQHSAAC